MVKGLKVEMTVVWFQKVVTSEQAPRLEEAELNKRLSVARK
jgi:hypothetical protein